MLRQISDRGSPEYQKLLHNRYMYRLYGMDYKDMIWLEDTVARLKKKLPDGDYTNKDYEDFYKAKDIYIRIKAKRHPTTHYIWRTQNDDKVRPGHAANDALVF